MNERIASDMVPEGSVLRVRVGAGGLAEGLAQFSRAVQAAQRGESVEPTFAVSFAQIQTMLAAFTPWRWELIATLREAGPSSVRALAQRLGRDYKNVHGDVAALEQWMAVLRLPDGRVHVPWREIVVGMRLPDRLAA